uniref:Putative ixodes 26 kDa salivary protein n=1 Tax=Ixodes ricinus TaxID=34613 RepID=A0A0K8R311_IXORI
MTGFIGALVFALCTLCSAAQPGPQRVRQKINRRENSITIDYLLDRNEFKSQDAALTSGVGKWLLKVQEQAQLKLKQDIDVEIKFKIRSLDLTNEEFSKNLQTWISAGSCGSESLMHAGSVLGEIKEESTYWPSQPHIVCVLTKYKLYQGDLINLLGYVLHKHLCYTSVPMLLTYNASSDVVNTGKLLSELVLNSTAENHGMKWQEYFSICDRTEQFNRQYVPRSVRTSQSHRYFKHSRRTVELL